MNKRFFHIRNLEDGGEFSAIAPHGGITFLVQDTGSGTVAVSKAECSLKDNYCRRTGRSFAQDHGHKLMALSELPSYMADTVVKSKRMPSPATTDFSFVTKYFGPKE